MSVHVEVRRLEAKNDSEKFVGWFDLPAMPRAGEALLVGPDTFEVYSVAYAVATDSADVTAVAFVSWEGRN